MTATNPSPQSTPAPSEGACPACGWPDPVPYQVVSRHHTSIGVIVYSRCVCGALQVRREAVSGRTRLLARGAPSDRRPLHPRPGPPTPAPCR